MTLDKTIESALQNSITYSEYRDLVASQVEHKKTSGDNQSEALINYTMLNNRRMKRWDKTVKINEEVVLDIKKFDGKLTWLVLTESWCGDAAHVIPVLNKIAELNNNIKLKLVFRDDHLELMDQFLTHGGRSIPKVIVIEENSNEVIDSYGPRPSTATKMVNDYKKQHGTLTPKFKEDLQRWYNKDKGQTVISDILKTLNL
ncbi:thioredoxin family protein [Ichthyenterobacterium sp. W332]|uniref:Thioredoxin family protein n=1 Tax=Microcosmobacter mediterraneus TaxID=3075607 RepID=A0ABU2YLL8_9FLAO|nr:thioredoxin family protein [Ichthyenterobacterium sp. W332]MDT0558599.1 thioredoxin family protein [Ichthyenterobacterium sp. W332]